MTTRFPLGAYGTQRMLCLALPVVFTQHSLAQSALNESGAELPAVTVSATRANTKIEDLDLSTTVIDRAAIERMSGQSLDQVLNRIASIRTSDVIASSVHPTGQQILLRGFANARTLVLLDGIPLNDAFYNTVSWESVPKESIERIEVIRGGGASSLWGNLAVGGVINIITRKPEAGKSNLSATIGTHDTQRYYAQTGIGINEQLTLNVEASHYQTAGYNLTPGQFQTSGLSNTAGLANNVRVGAFYNPSQQTQGFLKASVYTAHEDGLTYELANNRLSSYNISAGLQHRINSDTSIDANAYTRRTDFFTQNAGLRSGNNCGPNGTGGTSACPTYNFNNPASSPGFVVSLRDTNPYDDIGGSAILSQRFSGWNAPVLFGIDYRKITGSTDGIRYSTATSSIQGAVAGEVLSQGQQSFTGVFAQTSWLPKGMPFQITLSAREDFYKNTDGNRTDAIAGTTTQLPDNSFSRFDPRISGKYFVNDAVDLRAAAYRAFRAPGMNNLYRTFISGRSVTLSNASLKPETVNGFELGTDWRFGQGSIEVTAFYNKVDDVIDSTTLNAASAECQATLAGATSCRQNQNVAKAVIKGLEIFSRYDFNRDLQGRLSLTRNISTITASQSAGSPQGNQIGGVPRMNAIASLDWSPAESLRLSSQVRYTPSFFNDTAQLQVNEQATLVDLSARYKVSPQIELALQVTNLFDKRYISTGTSSTTTPPTQGTPRMGFLSVKTAF